MTIKKNTDPYFYRSEVATILQVVPATIANREKKGIYPEPNRDLNDKRIYKIDDIFRLQSISYGKLDPKPIVECLYDKGYRDTKLVQQMLDTAISKITKKS